MNEDNEPHGPERSGAELQELVRVRRDGEVMQMDLPTLITLIQQNAVAPSAQVNSAKLTDGEWKQLGELELYRVFGSGSHAASPKPQNEMPLPPATRGRGTKDEGRPTGSESAAYEDNLSRFFGSLAIKQLQIDAFVALTSAVAAAALSIIAHGSVVVLILMILGWGLGYMLADQVLFPRWIRGIRNSGFKRLPWQSRYFLIVAVVLPGYFLIAAFLPRLPAEGLLRLIDSVVGVLFSAATAAIWTFQLVARRMKRTFELTAPSQTDGQGDEQRAGGDSPLRGVSPEKSVQGETPRFGVSPRRNPSRDEEGRR